jgi:FkbM family methyltransferase
MVRKFSKEHPWLYRIIKKNYWLLLSSSLKRESCVYQGVEFDFRVRLNIKDDSVSKRIFFESYERETTSLLRKLVSPGDVIYDIGANIGYYSLLFSKLVGSTGWVHSFEPSQREFLALCENIKINNLKNVYLNQLAVSDISGNFEMSVFESSTFGAYNTLGIPNHHKVEKEAYKKNNVRTIKLDDYYSIYCSQKPSVIKIDVEGAELGVLKGGHNLFTSKGSPIIVLEICEETLMGLNVSSSQVKDLLADYGYQLFSIQPGGLLTPLTLKDSTNVVATKEHAIQRIQQIGLLI